MALQVLLLLFLAGLELGRVPTALCSLSSKLSLLQLLLGLFQTVFCLPIHIVSIVALLLIGPYQVSTPQQAPLNRSNLFPFHRIAHQVCTSLVPRMLPTPWMMTLMMTLMLYLFHQQPLLLQPTLLLLLYQTFMIWIPQELKLIPVQE